MGNFIKKYEIWVYLILAPLTSVFFVKARTNELISSSIYNNGRFVMLLFLLICILKYTRGNKGIINLFKPMLNWRVHPKWYLLSLVFPSIIAITALIVKAFYNNVEFATFLGFEADSFRSYLRLMVWAFLGEVVWVSYSINELSKKTNPFYAGQIVAVFWGLWFVPVILLGEGIFPKIPIIPAFIFRFGSAGMCAYIYSHTKSGICVLLLQFAVNFTLVSFAITPTNGGPRTYSLFGGIYFLAMLAIWLFDYLIQKRRGKSAFNSGLSA